MKNKIVVLALIASMAIPNTTWALDNFTRSEILAKAPIYLRVEIGKRLLSEYSENVEYTGTIEAVHGTMTVAKEILIGADETLSNAEKDTSKASSKINFDFKTPFFKGMILKVQPDADYPESGAEMGQLIFSLKNKDGVMGEVYRFPFSQLNNSFISAAGAYFIGSLGFPFDADLKARDEAFQKNLVVAGELQIEARWAREMYLGGKISADLYNKFETLADLAWVNQYNETGYFQWRYNRLKTYMKNEKVTPALFYGGLNLLMKRVMK